MLFARNYYANHYQPHTQNTLVCVCAGKHSPDSKGVFCRLADIFAVVIATGKRPVSIPNLEAKPVNADGTAPGRVWESRKPPQPLLDC